MTPIPLSKILPNPQQPRATFDAAELESLAQSIRENGVILPIAVEESANGFYILHDGERRTRAAKMAGLTEINAVISPPLNGTGAEMRLQRALVANVQRSDLNPVEEARAYEALRAQGLTIRQISKNVGIYEARINNRLELLRLDLPIQELVAHGKLPKDQKVIAAFMKIPAAADRIQLAEALAARSPSIATCVNAATHLLAEIEDKARMDTPSPALTIATATARRQVDLPNWDALAQLGKIPPWASVITSANEMCGKCTLRPVASSTMCSECPGVELLRSLITIAAIKRAGGQNGKL